MVLSPPLTPSQWQQLGRAAFQEAAASAADPLPELPSLRSSVSCHLVTASLSVPYTQLASLLYGLAAGSGGSGGCPAPWSRLCRGGSLGQDPRNSPSGEVVGVMTETTPPPPPPQKPTEGCRKEPASDSGPSVCRTGLGRRTRLDKHRQQADYRGQGEESGEVSWKTANRCGHSPPAPPPRVGPALADFLPRNDVRATSEVASLTSRHSHPFSRARWIFPAIGQIPLQHMPRK